MLRGKKHDADTCVRCKQNIIQHLKADKAIFCYFLGIYAY